MPRAARPGGARPPALPGHALRKTHIYFVCLFGLPRRASIGFLKHPVAYRHGAALVECQVARKRGSFDSPCSLVFEATTKLEYSRV